MKLRVLAFSAAVASLSSAVFAAEPPDYLRDVKPIFEAHCFDCHSGTSAESGLRLDAGSRLLDGGSSGPAVLPKKSAASLLIRRVTTKDESMRMPPPDAGGALTEEQVALLRRWIDAGAHVPADEQSAADDPRLEHWAFQPIERPPLPAVKQTDWIQNPVDRFVLAKLEAKGIEPSPEAEKSILLRRVSLDLIGLPPTPQELAAFLADERPGAYERAVDRLLASPHYGERWGRHWLDQARYADSDGYTNDVPREIWLYRDWVIDALNRDQPFDEFTIDQLAGDLRPEATRAEVIATGFHRNTQHNREGGSDPEQYRVERVVDRVSTTGSVFLGLTVGCARCHEHKYDPLSQREFYEFYAFFNNSDEPKYSVPTAEQEQKLKRLGEQIAAAGKLAADKSLSPEAKKEAQQELDRLKKEQQTLRRRIPTTLVMKERSRTRETYVHLRGDFLSRGRTVTPDVPAALPPLPADVEEPTRLDLARWLTDPQHPLTARVISNRIWQRYFGRGIVLTENDFGTQGSPPTHPQLLDYLASEFIHRGWSLKSLHRLIVRSAVYRQSSRLRPEVERADPENKLLARQSRHRLEAEVIRDSALAVSGLLSHTMHGPGVHPPQPDGVMKLARNPNRKWVVSPGEDRYRRGLYTYFWRGTPYPFLKAFDAPDSNSTCTRRDRSNTPLQALMLLNDEAFFEAAQALAARILREAGPEDDARLRHGFRLCLLREPNEVELKALTELLAAERADNEGDAAMLETPALKRMPTGVAVREALAWTTLARALLNTDEFITRE